MDPDEKIHALAKRSEEETRKQLQKVEKFPVYFYEEGIQRFATYCGMRQMIATKRFYGQPDYSFYDLMQDLFDKKEDVV